MRKTSRPHAPCVDVHRLQGADNRVVLAAETSACRSQDRKTHERRAEAEQRLFWTERAVDRVSPFSSVKIAWCSRRVVGASQPPAAP